MSSLLYAVGMVLAALALLVALYGLCLLSVAGTPATLPRCPRWLRGMLMRPLRALGNLLVILLWRSY